MSERPAGDAVPVPDAGDDTLEPLRRSLHDVVREQRDAAIERAETAEAAVQSERERADRLVSWKDTGFRERDKWRERAEKAEAAIERAWAVWHEHTDAAYLSDECVCVACDMGRALEGTVTTP